MADEPKQSREESMEPDFTPQIEGNTNGELEQRPYRPKTPAEVGKEKRPRRNGMFVNQAGLM